VDAAAEALPLFVVVSVTLKLAPSKADAGGLLMLVMTRSGATLAILNPLLVAPLRPVAEAVRV
jgi:hypothetical protein